MFMKITASCKVQNVEDMKNVQTDHHEKFCPHEYTKCSRDHCLLESTNVEDMKNVQEGHHEDFCLMNIQNVHEITVS